jgi:outer membrane protein assembly factor BamD
MRRRRPTAAASPTSERARLRDSLNNVKIYAIMGVLLVATACGGSVRGGDSTEYSVSASQNYERGVKALEEEEWTEAVKFFQFVKARFPYSKYAVLATLRTADAAFGAESYLEAIDAYKMFIKFHPTHEMVENGYAAFRVGESYYKMLPDDWFLVPPAHEKDQSAALDAARELATVIRQYPGSPHLEKAKELHRKVARLLARHEWYVANFYWKRKQPMGTVMRLRALLKRYPDVGFDEQALLLLARAYRQAGRTDDARKSFESFLERFPKHDRAGEARRELEALSAKRG